MDQISPENAFHDLYVALREQKMLDRIQITYKAILFLNDNRDVIGWSFNTMNHYLERYIRNMNPDNDYLTCNKCGNTLVITGHERMHHSRSIYYFCLNCTASYMIYRTSELSLDFGMLYPDFIHAIE
jgi:hypothetical protein